MAMQPKTPKEIEEEADEAFLRRFALSQEDLIARGVCREGYQWFRSENVVDLVPILRKSGKLHDRCGEN
jgi:hypothetical protein